VRSLQLTNHVAATTLASVDSIAVANEMDSAGNHAVTVQSTLGKIPPGAKVYVDWVARTGPNSISSRPRSAIRQAILNEPNHSLYHSYNNECDNACHYPNDF
jgi:hypothetical protein